MTGRQARAGFRAPSAVVLATLALAALAATAGGRAAALAPGDVTVYGDGLASGWSDWSWGTTLDPGASDPVYEGTAALAVTFTEAWGGLYLHVDPSLAGDSFAALRFAIHGGSGGGQLLRVLLVDGSGAFGPATVLSAPASAWGAVEVSFEDLGSPTAVTGIVWQDTSGGAQPVFYLDEIVLVAGTAPPGPTPTPSAGPSIVVNAAAGVHSISDDIYGMNFADETLAAELRLSVRRRGGNSTSRYNWLNDTTNTGSDWYFENVPETAGDAEAFVEQDRRTGSRSLLTVPLIGWVAKARPSGHPYDCGFKVSRYGAQQSVDPWDTDCGNGVAVGGAAITGNDPTDTSVAIGPAFVQAWVEDLVATFDDAAHGGVAYYDLDNEPMLWPDTHRDVHPEPTSYDEMRDRTLAYAAAVKTADPTSATLGPVVWGWTAYFWSALDWAAGGSWWIDPTDRTAHGGVPFVEWYLEQMQAWEQANGTRILDYLDLHFYPPGVALTGAGDASLQARRLRSTRLLWDPTYVEESWIAEPVYLVPRMHAWVATRYPGTRLAVTEYNWGALDSLNGALAQADVLGIFGREGLDLATLWAPPEAEQPGAYAFRMYRNADGQGNGFGELGVLATSDDEARLAVFAAVRVGSGELTIIVINKTTAPLTSTLALVNFVASGPAQEWRYSGADLDAIQRMTDLAVGQPETQVTFPASSITLLVVPGAGGPIETRAGRARRILRRRR